MWGGRQIRIPFPQKRTGWLRFDTSRYRKHVKPDPDAPNLEAVPRATEIRRDLRRAADLYRSPIRWILFAVAAPAALISIGVPNDYGAVVNLLCVPAVAGAYLAAFALSRRNRIIWSLGLMAVGLAVQDGGEWPYSGTALLLTGFGLQILSYWGPRPDWVRRQRKRWVREHSRKVARGATAPRLVAKRRTRELREEIRAEARRLRSSWRWSVLFGVVVLGAAIMLPASMDGLGYAHFTGMLAIAATGVAAFATDERFRAIGGIVALLAGAAAALAGGLGWLGLPIGLAGLVTGFVPDRPEPANP